MSFDSNDGTFEGNILEKLVTFLNERDIQGSCRYSPKVIAHHFRERFVLHLHRAMGLMRLYASSQLYTMLGLVALTMIELYKSLKTPIEYNNLSAFWFELLVGVKELARAS
ncbi:MAG: hypothetical protein ACJ0PV_03240 [Flavobacteriaceae bacterium]